MKYILSLSLIVVAFIATAQRKSIPIHKSRTVNIYHSQTATIAPQRKCHTMLIDSLLHVKYKMDSQEEFETKLAAIQKSKANFRTGTDTITIPFIVHVVHNNEALGTGANITTAQVYSQIDVLNEDYNKKIGTKGHNTNSAGAALFVKFVKALVKPDGSILAEPGINRVSRNLKSYQEADIEEALKPSTIFDPTRYLNMWTVRFGGDMDGTLGYAQFPSLSQLSGLQNNEGLANTDGVVISFQNFGRVGNVVSPYNLGRTATHEIGHFLGLRHIWGDVTKCKGTDYCNDTPQTTDAFYGCPSNPKSCVTGTRAMIENYMDYSDDNCMNILTANQISRINTVLTNSPRRKELLVSKVFELANKPKADFTASTFGGCEGSIIDFIDKSLVNPSAWLWTISQDGFTVFTSTSQNFSLKFSDNGLYDVKLEVKNAAGLASLTKQNFINISTEATLSLPFTEDFENNIWLDNWNNVNPNYDSTYWYSIENINAFGLSQGNALYFIDNYGDSTDLSGTTDSFISPAIDFQANQNAYLSFDIAYSMYKDGVDTFADTLAIGYTNGCGSDFVEIWRKGGSLLQTTTIADTGFFDPKDNQWRSEQIPLSALNGKSSVSLVFKNISGWGNALYLDNVKIVSNIGSAVPVTDFNVNPATLCGGNMVVLSDNSTNYPTAWKWQVTNRENTAIKYTSTVASPTFNLTIPGSYDVSFQASNAMGNGTAKVKSNFIKVLPNPSVRIVSSAVNNTVCKSTVTLT
ncbi:MAG: M43 family zinc metalloprotease, partial [Cytophagales bacterium]